MNEISDNLLSAFLEGNTSAEDTLHVLEAAQNDPELRRVIDLCSELDRDDMEFNELLPVHALAAKADANHCAVMCELFILKRHGVTRTIADREEYARQHGWLKEGGTPIHDIGRLLEREGFTTSRTYHNSIEDLQLALADHDVIAVVDGKELTTDDDRLNQEKLEDTLLGSDPNHAIVVISAENGTVTYYEPEIDAECSISIEQFVDAWNDSSRYMVKII